MANPDLEKIYGNIEMSDAELSSARDKLSAHLAQLAGEKEANNNVKNALPFQAPQTAAMLQGKSRTWLQQPRFLGFAAAVIALFFSFASVLMPPSLDNSSLEEIQRFVAKNGDHEALFSRAEEMKASESTMTRLNALALESMLGFEERNKLATAQGLVEDPRPEFRAYYLEYLLDYADEDHYNIAYIEALMEKEVDDECLYLLGRLLKLAVLKQPNADIFI